MDYIEIGKQIRKYRILKRLSQETLAEKIDISTTHMSHIETGSTKLSLPVLVKLAQALQVSSDDILNINVENSRNSTLSEITKDCSPEEIEIIAQITKAAKKSLQGFSIKQNSSSYDQ